MAATRRRPDAASRLASHDFGLCVPLRARARADNPRWCARFGARRAVGIEVRPRPSTATRQSSHILMTSRPLRRALEHPVLAFELGGDALDRALDAERLAAADALERLFLLEHARGAVAARKSSCGVRLITFSGQVALHSPHCTQASSAKRSIGRSGSAEQRAGRAGRHAGEAQRAALDVELDRAERRAGRQRHDIDRRRRGAVQLAQRQPQHVALGADRREARRPRRGRQRARWRAAPRRARPDRRSRSWRRGRRRSRGRRGSAPPARSSCSGRRRRAAACARSRKRSALAP